MIGLACTSLLTAMRTAATTSSAISSCIAAPPVLGLFCRKTTTAIDSGSACAMNMRHSSQTGCRCVEEEEEEGEQEGEEEGEDEDGMSDDE